MSGNKGTATAGVETSLKKSSGGDKGALVIIRPSELAEKGTTGVVAEGIYEGSEANKFNAAKKDYFIRGADNTLYILNETKSVREQMDQIEGMDNVKLKVVYNGKLETKNGRGFHDFEIFTVA